MGAADELEVVVTDELGGDAGTEQPAGPARGNRPVLHLTRDCLSHENTQLLIKIKSPQQYIGATSFGH